MQHLIDDKPKLLERMRHIKAIYTDLDGTMLGRGGTLLVDGEGNPSTRVAEVIVELTEAGIPIIPTTGRSDFQLVEIVRMCGLDDFIGESGAVLSWWTGKNREERYILPHWDEKILKGRTPLQVMQDEGAAELLYEAFPGQLEPHTPWDEPRKASELLRGRIDLVKAQVLLDGLDIAVDVTENGAINPKVHTLAKPISPDQEQIHAYHIVPAGVSKANAITVDLKRRGVEPEHALMIGDGLSDLQCASSVGVALMVENARRSPGVMSSISHYKNAAFVRGKKGDGWVHMAELVLEGLAQGA
ncbi:MAG: HAD hydrolase family protein [Actinomycetia bacterium]|nr:HAD hydrolase family protein [Actinomycetes bacterium]